MSSFNQKFSINANSNGPSSFDAPALTETGDLLLQDFNEEQKRYIVREVYPILKQTLHHVSSHRVF